MAGLEPPNAQYATFCRDCGSQQFAVAWLIAPRRVRDDTVLPPSWGIQCVVCKRLTLLDPSGPDPETIHHGNLARSPCSTR